MTLQSSGEITLLDIRGEFGGSAPDAFSEYYRAGANVPDTPLNDGIPKSGTIALSDFYGGDATVPIFPASLADDVEGNPVQSAGFVFTDDGLIFGYHNGDLVDLGTWWPGAPLAGIGAGFEIRHTGTTGTWDVQSSIEDAWISLSADRTYRVLRTAMESEGTDGVGTTFQIRPDGGGVTFDSVTATATATTTTAPQFSTTLTDSVSGSPPQVAGFTFTSTGRILDAAGNQIATWWPNYPDTTGMESYEIRHTGTTGTFDSQASAEDAWISLASNRAYTKTRTSGEGAGTDVVSGSFEIRHATTHTVFDTVSFSVSAEVVIQPTLPTAISDEAEVSGTSASAGFIFTSDGQITGWAEGAIGTWYPGAPVTGIGNDYEIRYTSAIGDDFAIKASNEDVWISLSSDRTYRLLRNVMEGIGSDGINCDFEIRPTGGGAVIDSTNASATARIV